MTKSGNCPESMRLVHIIMQIHDPQAGPRYRAGREGSLLSLFRPEIDSPGS